ncbi:MAG: DUF1800 family protein [Acidimicrobiales bacterium]
MERWIWADAEPREVAEWALGAPPLPVSPEGDLADGGYDDLAVAWLARMLSPAAGLHDKLTWFWHGHWTSGASKVGEARLLHRQHLVLRPHALGSFRDLAHDLTVDAAMLLWLDGDPSSGDAPNENYARELMELFTLGRGNYTEADVRAGALALAGWEVDQGKVRFDPDRAHRGEVSFLGRRGRLDAHDVVDLVCDHPACASFVAAKLHTYLVGAPPSPGRLEELAGLFRGRGLQIEPLVRAILLHDDFLAADARHARPRSPLEWWVAAYAAGAARRDRRAERSGDDGDGELSAWPLRQLDQMPFDPPNVAGWPQSPAWVSSTQVLTRTRLVANLELAPLDWPSAPAAAQRASLVEVSPSTAAALDAAEQVEDEWERAWGLRAVALLSPEFALA